MPNTVARPAPELQEAEVRGSPVWRFVRPGELSDPQADESYVVPEITAPGKGMYGSFLIGAQYELENGSLLPGLVQVDILDTQVECAPVTIFASGKSVDPLGRDAEARLQRILQSTGVRPIRWRLDVLLVGEVAPRSRKISRSGLVQAAQLLAQLVRLGLRRKYSGEG